MNKIKSITVHTVDGRSITLPWDQFGNLLDSVLSQAMSQIKDTVNQAVFNAALGDDLVTATPSTER